jgi:hypothetical protein
VQTVSFERKLNKNYHLRSTKSRSFFNDCVLFSCFSRKTQIVAQYALCDVIVCAIFFIAQTDQPDLCVWMVCGGERDQQCSVAKAVGTGLQNKEGNRPAQEEGPGVADGVRPEKEIYFLKPKIPPLLFWANAGLLLGGINSRSNVLISSTAGCITGSAIRRWSMDAPVSAAM